MVIANEPKPNVSNKSCLNEAESTNQKSTHTPIIMVTGQNEDEVKPKMQGGNIDFLIFKPFKLNNFYKAVQASFEFKSS
jgi:FixJ family two-component response regulator